MRILSLNAGSSTLKFALFGANGVCLHKGAMDRLGQESAELDLQTLGEPDRTQKVGALTFSGAVRLALESVGEIEAVGCRVVHGGALFSRATEVTQDVVTAIRNLAPLAPLHNSRDLEVIRAVQGQCPNHPLVAVFDTAFHSCLPDLAMHYAIPKDLEENHSVRRFGFHGISYRYIVDQMALKRGGQKGKLIVCHLGSGASICAVRDGNSVETSMGMTPLEGLVMGTRSGDIDPGAVLYLLRERGMSVKQADYLLNHESGLLGLSGRSADVRDLEQAAANGDEAAEFALEAFCYRIAKYIGAYSVVLDGFDSLVFSGGIGENSEGVRRRICRRLRSLGIREPSEPPTSDTASCLSGAELPSVWVVRTDEERQIAKETLEVMTSESRVNR